ncbi:hypothetical protein FOZ63_022710, partial [Perkinsus olseni]
SPSSVPSLLYQVTCGASLDGGTNTGRYLRPLRLSFLAKDDFDWKHALDQGGRNPYNNQRASRVMKDSPPSRMSMLSTSGRASLLDRAAAGYLDESDEDDDSEQQE